MNLSVKHKMPWHMLPSIFVLAWPTILEQLMQTAVQYIDVAMVGSIGTQATAAVGSTGTVNWLVNSTISAVGIGFLSYISQARGAGEYQRAKKASAQSVLAVLTLGILFTAVILGLSGRVPVWMEVDPEIQHMSSVYFFIIYSPMLFRTATIIFGTVLRAVGDSKTPMWVGLLVNLINIILNILLIYPSRTISVLGCDVFMPGTGWGVYGAGIASAISLVIGGIIITVKLLTHPDISPLGYSIRPDSEILIPCIRVSFPNCLQRFGTSLGYVVFAAMINSLGDVAAAAHTIANTVESAFYVPGYGMQTAAATLAGNAWGANDRQRIRDLTKMIIPIEVILMTVSGGLLFVLAPPLMRIFSKDEQVILLGATVLRMVALSEPFYGVSVIIEGLMQGVGKTVLPFIYNIVGMWGVRIVGTYICIELLDMGLVSAWACMIGHNLFLFGIFTFLCITGQHIPKTQRKFVKNKEISENST